METPEKQDETKELDLPTHVDTSDLPDADLQENDQLNNQDDPIDNEKVVLEVLKSKGFEVESIDDLDRFKEPQIKEVNPFDDVMDEDDRRYFAYKKATGGSRNEFDKLNIDPESVSLLDYAVERVRREGGANISQQDAIEILEEELGIEDFNKLSPKEQLKLARYSKEIKEERIKAYNDFREITSGNRQEKNSSKEEMVVFENGQKMPKKEYDKMVKNRQMYLDSNKESVNSVTESVFKLSIDDNGTPKEVSFNYEYNDQDRQSMLSMTEDTGKLLERYSTEKGFDHKQFNEDVFWLNPENRNKAIASLIHKAIALNTEEVLKSRGNVNLTNPSIDKQKPKDVEMVSLNSIFSK